MNRTAPPCSRLSNDAMFIRYRKRGPTRPARSSVGPIFFAWTSFVAGSGYLHSLLQPRARPDARNLAPGEPRSRFRRDLDNGWPAAAILCVHSVAAELLAVDVVNSA